MFGDSIIDNHAAMNKIVVKKGLRPVNYIKQGNYRHNIDGCVNLLKRKMTDADIENIQAFVFPQAKSKEDVFQSCIDLIKDQTYSLRQSNFNMEELFASIYCQGCFKIIYLIAGRSVSRRVNGGRVNDASTCHAALWELMHRYHYLTVADKRRLVIVKSVECSDGMFTAIVECGYGVNKERLRYSYLVKEINNFKKLFSSKRYE